MFITRVTIDNIVMRVIQLNTADWVCSKTQILLVTFKTRNQPCISKGEHVFPRVGCDKSKHQCLTVPRNQWLLHWCELTVLLFLKARKSGRWCAAKKSDSLESAFVEMLERTHQLGLNETAKSIRVWAEEDESPWAWSNNFEIKFADGSVVVLTVEWVPLGLLKEWQDKGILDLIGDWLWDNMTEEWAEYMHIKSSRTCSGSDVAGESEDLHWSENTGLSSSCWTAQTGDFGIGGWGVVLNLSCL